MDPVLNPYSPCAGRKPAALVGRDQPRADWKTALARVEIGRSNQPFVLYGLRGVGKTVLLSDFRREAQSRRWIVAQVEAGAGETSALRPPTTRAEPGISGSPCLRAPAVSATYVLRSLFHSAPSSLWSAQFRRLD